MGDTENPLASASLKRPLDGVAITEQAQVNATSTTAETVPSNGQGGSQNGAEAVESAAKRPKLDGEASTTPDSRDRVRGVAMIKAE